MSHESYIIIHKAVYVETVMSFSIFRVINVIMVSLSLSVNAMLEPDGVPVAQDFISCIANLIEKNFDKPGLVVFGNTYNVTGPVVNIRTEILMKIHESMNFSVKIATPSEEVNVCDENADDNARVLHKDHRQPIPAANYYVIPIDNFKDFIFMMGKLIRSRSWNPHAKFIIFLINFNNDADENIETVENILSCLFRYNVLNVLVAVQEPGRIRNVLLYSWRPYDPPRFCGYFNETARNRLILENICECGVMRNKTLLFYNKLPNDMMNCVLSILAIKRQPFVGDLEDDPSIEKFYMNWVFKTFNFTVDYKIVNNFRGERNIFGIWDGALSKLVAKEGNILLGGIFPDFDVHEDFDYSTSYLADSYAWVVPRADPSPPWMAMTIIFKTTVWCSIGAGFVLCVLSWKLLGILSDDSKYQKSLMHIFLNTCIISVGFSAYVRPVKQCLRIFFVFLNLYCTLLLTAYQTKLIEVLQSPMFENQLDTVEDLVRSGLKFGGTEELHDLFSNSNDTFDKVVKDNWINVDDMLSALIDVGVNRNFSVLCSRLELAHLSATIPELNDRHGNLRYYTFKVNTFTVPSEMVALRGYPFMKNFSASLGVFKQMGMNDGIRRLFARLNLRKRARLLLSLNVQGSDFIPLSILHLQGGFLALCIGIFSGSVVLIVELIVSTELFRKLCF